MREMGVFIALFWLFGAGIAVAAPDATSRRADVSAARVAAIDATSRRADISAARVAAIDTFFRDEVRRRRLPGAVAAIVGAGCGWPLGDPTRHSDAVMTNLLGDDANDWRSLAAIRVSALHLYGKGEAREGRKMGHFTRLHPLGLRTDR